MADAIPVGRKVAVKKEAELASGASEYIDSQRDGLGEAKDFAKGDESGRIIETGIEVKKGDEIVMFTHRAVRVDH